MAIAYRGGSTGAKSIANADRPLTIPRQAGVQVGDRELCYFTCASNTDPSITPPPGRGWTLVTTAYDPGSPGVKLAVYQRLAFDTSAATPSEAWDYDAAALGAVGFIGAWYSTTGGQQVGVGVSDSVGASASSATRVSPALTTAAAGWLAHFHADRSGTTWSGVEGTQRFADFRTGAASLLVADTAANVAAGTHDLQATASASTSTRADGILLLVEEAATEPLPVLSVVDSANGEAQEPFTTTTLTATSTTDSVTWSKVSGEGPAPTPTGDLTASVTHPATMDGDTSVYRATATNATGSSTADVTLTTYQHNAWVNIGGTFTPVEILTEL